MAVLGILRAQFVLILCLVVQRVTECLSIAAPLQSFYVFAFQEEERERGPSSTSFSSTAPLFSLFRPALPSSASELRPSGLPNGRQYFLSNKSLFASLSFCPSLSLYSRSLCMHSQPPQSRRPIAPSPSLSPALPLSRSLGLVVVVAF